MGDKRFGALAWRALVVLAVAVGATLTAAPAHAALSESPDPSDMTNGRVYSIVRAGERIYVAGEFSAVYSEPGGPAVPRANVAAFFAATGRVDPSWRADADNRVYRLAASESRLYMGGDFRNVNNVLKKRFVAVDLDTGGVDAGFEADARAKVTSILVDEPHVYIGGDFEWVEGFDRFHLARVNAATGDVDPGWNPGANHRAWDMELSPDGDTLFIGGTFTEVGGQPHNHLAAIDKDTGNVLSSFNGNSQYDTRNIAVDASRVYAAVEGPGGRVSAFDQSSGARLWVQTADGDAQAVAAAHGRVYAGGHWHDFDGDSHPRIVTLDPATGNVDNSFAPDINSGGALGVWDLVADGPDLLVGGDFTRVNGEEQHRFARFSDASADAAPTVMITAPSDGTETDSATTVTFGGAATDPEDGDLSASIDWSSSLDGSLGSGASITTTLSVGTHTVTASVTDSVGGAGSDSIQVLVTAVGNPPSVAITAPSNGTETDTTTAVTFVGTATDPEDGNLSASIDWSSSLDGSLGSGASITTTLSLGTHTVTASVTDSDGGADADSIQVVVTLPGDPPSVTITDPPSGSTVASGSALTLQGSASDPEDGNLTSSIQWESDRDGALGVGGSVSTALSDGVHLVTASVADSDGHQDADSITITVEQSLIVSSIGQAGFGGKNANKHLRATIDVIDSGGAQVSGATISMTLLRGSSPSMSDATVHQSSSGTTDAGSLVVTFKNIPSGCYRVVVTDVTADGADWDGSSPSPDPDPWCT